MPSGTKPSSERKTIGVFASQVGRAWGAEFLAGITAAAEEHNVNLVHFIGGKITPLVSADHLVKRTENFLEGGVQSLSILGVSARTTIRSGSPAEEIAQEVSQGVYDLLVMGLPLARASGKISLSGIDEQILNTVTDRAILVVRSQYLGARSYPIMVRERDSHLPDPGRT